MIWVGREAEYFWREGWTGFSDLPVGQSHTTVTLRCVAMMVYQTPLSSPGLTGQSSPPRPLVSIIAGLWDTGSPAFAGDDD